MTMTEWHYQRPQLYPKQAEFLFAPQLRGAIAAFCAPLTVTNSTFSGNSAPNAGAIFMATGDGPHRSSGCGGGVQLRADRATQSVARARRGPRSSRCTPTHSTNISTSWRITIRLGRSGAPAVRTPDRGTRDQSRRPPNFYTRNG